VPHPDHTPSPRQHDSPTLDSRTCPSVLAEADDRCECAVGCEFGCRCRQPEPVKQVVRAQGPRR